MQANTLMGGLIVMEGCVWVCGVVRSLVVPSPTISEAVRSCGSGFLSRGFCLPFHYLLRVASLFKRSGNPHHLLDSIASRSKLAGGTAASKHN